MPYPTGTTPSGTVTRDNQQAEFINNVRASFKELQTEISERNADITRRDDFVYGSRLEKSLDIPIGHDSTPVNWLRRTVEIHKNMFMSRGFQVVSTYDTETSENAESEEDRQRLEVENGKQKKYAEARQNLIKAVMEDNGGMALWANLAESASAVGDACIKTYYNEEEEKFEICPIESIENVYVLWNKDDFRKYDAVAYAYQVSKQQAIRDYGASEDVTTSPMGHPMEILSATGVSNQFSGQPMVTVLEVTGKIAGWAAEKGNLKQVPIGQETELNALIIGSDLTRLITDSKKLPRYYLLPNKRQRRRPWGMSDVSDAAIGINLTYIETLSDWRTVAAKTNFNKYKAFGFGPDTNIPKPESRTVQFLPLSEGQDIVELNQSQTNGIDWGRQLEELKEQFVRETGLSRVLFDDPSVTLNSNQALLTSMKPTSDIAEAKKQLWAPVIVELFRDALETIVLNKPELKDLISEDDNWSLKVMWPSVMQKEDPVYQSMLLNRFNAGLMSVQSYMEAQGDTREEIDRIKDEAQDPLTAAILGKALPQLAQVLIQAATTEIQAWIMATLPQPPEAGGGNTPGVDSNGGMAAQIAPDNQATGGVGMQPVSQPGTGATSASPVGALAQTVQNSGG